MDKILRKFNKNDFAIARTLLYTSLHLSKNIDEGLSQVEYFRVIGSLIYLTSFIRLDLAYTVSKLARYTSNPRTNH